MNIKQLNNILTSVIVAIVSISCWDQAATSQIIPDATLKSENSTITPDTIKGLTSDLITGGAIRGNNLFHSFQEFNVSSGRGVYFSNPENIQNIFTRVTGSNPSQILGILGVSGNANLFFMNPNGILFGENVSLDMNGSFLGTTASNINFTDGTIFSAKTPQAVPVLTVSVPIGLGFGSNPGAISIQRNGQKITPVSGVTYERSLLTSPDGIGVQPGKTLALVGGDVFLQGALLKAGTGRIEVGAVGEGVVNLTDENNNLLLDYSNIQNFRDLQMSRQTYLVTTGEKGGSVQIVGRNITLNNESRITASTTGASSAGNITIKASNLLEMAGTNSLPGGVFAPTIGTGNAGNIYIETGQLIMQDGTRITAFSNGRGNGGTVNVKARDLIELSGASPDGNALTGLEGRAFATGNGGDVQIETQKLILRNGAQISASAFTASNSGIVNIKADDSVEVEGRAPNRRFPSALVTTVSGSGKGGELRIETANLIVRNGARVSASTNGSDRGGNLTIKASNSVQVIGTGVDEKNVPVRSGLLARSLNSGHAGNINITTNNLVVRDGAEITVAGLDQGAAGNLYVNANLLQLNNDGNITGATKVGEGGNIALTVKDLQLRRGSAIAATAEELSNGGNINIDTTRFIILENSDILATAKQGSGGNINLNTAVFIADLFTSNALEFGAIGTIDQLRNNQNADISASSEFGRSGNVEIPTFNNQVTNSFAEKSANFINSEQVVANSCLAKRNIEQGTFIVTGTGGLARTPDGAISDRYSFSTIPPNEIKSSIVNPSTTTLSSIIDEPAQQIREAQALVKTPDGRVKLQTNSTTGASTNQLICQR